MIELDLDKNFKEKILNDLKPIISGMGFEIVELKIGRAKKETHITVIIYKPDGVGINDCTAVSKTIYPRLEFFEELENFILKVTSPGIDRVFKNPGEYKIFGKKGT